MKEGVFVTDSRTLAYINLYSVLGSIPLLCELDEKASELVKGKKVSIGIAVKNGPSATLAFYDGKCEFIEDCEKCDVKLPFSSPEKFNGMIDGTVTPIPSKGFTKIGFLLGSFIKLTDILSAYLRPSDDDLADERFFEISTKLMFRLISSAITCIGNEDKVGKASASYITDGVVKLAIGDDLCHYIEAQENRLTLNDNTEKHITSYMRFDNIRLARDLFDGKQNAVACVGAGKIRIGGMISQVDNINRILDRVALYLA